MMRQNVRTSDDVSQYFKLTYLYMVLGVLSTSLISTIAGAFYGRTLFQLMGSIIYWVVVILIELLFVSSVNVIALNKNKVIAVSGFLIFAAFQGVIYAPFFMFSKPITAVAVLLSVDVLFIMMAVLGFTTKLDMSQLDGILLAATLAIIIASIVNLFLHSGIFSLIISAIVTLILSVWISYDNQKLRVTFEKKICGTRKQSRNYRCI